MSQCMSWPGPMRCCSSRSLPLSNAVTMSPATCRRHQDRQLAFTLENPSSRSKNNPLLTLPHPAWQPAESGSDTEELTTGHSTHKPSIAQSASHEKALRGLSQKENAAGLSS